MNSSYWVYATSGTSAYYHAIGSTTYSSDEYEAAARELQRSMIERINADLIRGSKHTWKTNLWKWGERSLANRQINLLQGRMRVTRGAAAMDRLILEQFQLSEIVKRTE
jgi:hypothetical protein